MRLDLVARASRTRACSVGEPQTLAMKPDVVTQYSPSDHLEVGVGRGSGGEGWGGGGSRGGNEREGPDHAHRNEKNTKGNNHFSIIHLTPNPNPREPVWPSGKALGW